MGAKRKQEVEAPPAVPEPKPDKTKKAKGSTQAEEGSSEGEREGRGYWLMKSEPHVFSIDDLAAKPGQVSEWEGVRNYQARNLMRDKMRVGDLAFFYHSSCKVPGIVGVVRVVKEGYPDHTQFDSKSEYYDPKATPDHPRWMMVDVQLVRRLPDEAIVSLHRMKEYKDDKGKPLANMTLLQKSRLSVQPVSKEEWTFITTTLMPDQTT